MGEKHVWLKFRSVIPCWESVAGDWAEEEGADGEKPGSKGKGE